jgi:hypothetical protein
MISLFGCGKLFVHSIALQLRMGTELQDWSYKNAGHRAVVCGVEKRKPKVRQAPLSETCRVAARNGCRGLHKAVRHDKDFPVCEPAGRRIR